MEGRRRWLLRQGDRKRTTKGGDGKTKSGKKGGEGGERREHFARGWVRLNRERVEHSWRVLCMLSDVLLIDKLTY